MPSSGNVLGERRYYEYTSDAGTKYKYLTDKDLGTAMGATEADNFPGFPRKFKPRGIYVRATIAGKQVSKFLIAPNPNGANYASETSVNVTIDTIQFSSTGRVGEAYSFGSNPAAAEPEPEP